MPRRSPDIVAIDAHVHLGDARALAARPQRAEQMAKYFQRERQVVPVEEMAEQYRKRRMMAVIMNSTDTTVTGQEPVPNDHIADVVSQHPDVFLGFGVVDPAAGSGAPGGGVKLKYANPIHLDDVAADFPDLTIICAHPSWPWESEALAVALHKPNVYIDLWGWAPKYMSAEVRTYVNSRIQDKALFGSDRPVLEVDRWLTEFDALDFKPAVREKVLLHNAKAALGLDRG